MGNNNLLYAIKVCLTSALISPALAVAINTCVFKTQFLNWQAWLADTLFSLLLAIPLGLGFYLTVMYVNHRQKFYVNKKFTLGLVAMFLIFLPVTLNLLYDVNYYLNFTVADLVRPVVHTLTAIIAIKAYRLSPPLEHEKIPYTHYMHNIGKSI